MDAGVVSGLGLAIWVANVGHLYRSNETALRLVWEGGVITLTAGLLVGAGVWLLRSDLESGYSWLVASRTLGGTFLMASVAGWMMVHQLWDGAPFREPTFLLGTAMTGGGIAGLGIGLNAVRAERTLESSRRARNRAEDRQRTFIFLNRLLRHHVLNGVQVILGHADLLGDHVDECGRRHLDTIESRAKTVAEVTQNVKHLADGLSRDSPPQVVDLVDDLDSVLGRMRAEYPDATFTLDAPESAPVRSNGLLGVVFRNLLSNAVEHNHHDADRVRVDVSVADYGDVVVARVVDNGPGIPDDEKEAVLRHSPHGDRGLGLYLVNRLVEQVGGTVRIRDSDPEGTVVTVVLQSPNAASRATDPQLAGRVSFISLGG